MVYIVTYDLNKEIRRPPIVKEIKDIGAWARLSESSYAVSTEMSVYDVHARLKKHIDSDDQIYIITLTAPWTGFGPKKVNDWLEKRLGS